MLGQAGLTAASADWADGEHVQQRNVVESELAGCGVAQAVALGHRRCSHRPVGGHIRAVGLAVADDLRIGFSLSQLWELLAELLTYVAALSPPLAAGLGVTGVALAVEYVGDGCRCRAVGYGAGRQRQRRGCRGEEDEDRAVTSWRVLRAGWGGIRRWQRRVSFREVGAAISGRQARGPPPGAVRR